MDQYRSPIDRSTLIRELLVAVPDTATTLATYGIHCGSCSLNASETLEDGMQRHALSTEDMEDLISDLNCLYRELPIRAHSVSITKDSALFLAQFTHKKNAPSLWKIIVDENHHLSLEEYSGNPENSTFSHPEVPHVRILIPPLLLPHVGGAEILVKEGRLTIDLPKRECCASPTSCTCKENGGAARYAPLPTGGG